MFFNHFLVVITVTLSAVQSVSALTLDISDPASIKNVAGNIAHGLMKYYTGNITNTPDTIAVLPAPYYWWEAGAMWGTMLDYYHYTGDSSYNQVTTQALESQVGPLCDYMMPNHQKDEGNDDQAFWGFATISAAEKNFPEPSNTCGSSWLQLTENLWNTQAARWDTSSCGGGLRWQIFSFNNGYTYKNSVSNGAFFQLSARLARFTGNQTYADWAEKVYDWTTKVGLMDPDFNVFDGVDINKACSDANEITWSYNNAIYLYGAAVMYNHTTDSTWKSRTEGLLKASKNFFTSDRIMYEQACETVGTCNNDQQSFKAYLSRFMWATTQMAPFTKDLISSYLTKSAAAAASICTGEANACGTKWYTGSFDKIIGIGQQMGALEVIQGLLISYAAPPIVKGQALVQAAPYSRSSAMISASSTSIVASSSVAPTVTSSSSATVTASSTKAVATNTIVGSNSQTYPVDSSTVHPCSKTILFTPQPSSTASSKEVKPCTVTPTSNNVQPSSEVHPPTALPSSVTESSPPIFSGASSASYSFTTSAPVSDTTITITVPCPTSSVHAKSTGSFTPSSRATALSTLATSTTHSSTSSTSLTALLIDTSAQPTPEPSVSVTKGASSISATVSATATSATIPTFTGAAGKNMRVSGTGLMAGVLGAGLFWFL
ncbi:hypothetical protein DSL72_002738 [Monilinia vaccinii-corymbosi]|uniref:mannan endo-1,6-alpha-mannosidase n=1 Tax=Monilinia vaccinii-corymbosi TaxID=61207 RepID=A0A8A3PDA1_9HELO|nr:hypothetical protein DSL72_002738 [Monilinia vaccinii-corymbosi]